VKVLNIQGLFALITIFIFGSLTLRVIKGKNYLPTGLEVLRDKWWRIPIFIGLGFPSVLTFLLLAFNV
jgi:hypothetical protein